MRKYFIVVSMVLSLGTVLVTKTIVAQDGWVRLYDSDPNDPISFDEAIQFCPDLSEPGCAVELRNGTPTLNTLGFAL